MPLPAAVAPLIAGAAKYGPLAGKLMATKLPWITGGIGALSQSNRGLGGMLQGGVMGGLTGVGLGGPLAGVLRPAAVGAAGLATKLGVSGPALGAVTGVTRAAIPLGAGLALGGLSGAGSGPVVGGAGNLAQGGMMLGSQQGNYPMPGNPNTTNVSGQHGGMMQMPDGSVWQQINPGGYQQGLRFGSGMDTDQNISNQNKWFQAQLPQWDEIERRKQSRAIQNAQLSSNIALARQLAGNRQIADLNIAQDANRSMGSMFANTAVPTLAM